MYGILALPLAAFVAYILAHKKWIVKYGFLYIFSFLIGFQLLQTKHYNKVFIHWDSMSKKAYWLNFMRTRNYVEYTGLLSKHDEELCRKGIYVYYDMREDRSYLKDVSDETGIGLMIKEIEQSRTLPYDIRYYARRMNIPVEDATRMTAERMLYMKRDHPFE